MILKIDVQGAQVVKEQVTGGAPDLPRPAVARGRCSSGCAAGRPRPPTSSSCASANAAIELARQEDYDYVVTNETGQVERTAERIDAIIADEHARHPTRRVRV